MRSRVPAIWFLKLSGWEHLEGGGVEEEEEEGGERGLLKVGVLLMMEDMFFLSRFGDYLYLCLCLFVFVFVFADLVVGRERTGLLIIKKRQGCLLERREGVSSVGVRR